MLFRGCRYSSMHRPNSISVAILARLTQPQVGPNLASRRTACRRPRAKGFALYSGVHARKNFQFNIGSVSRVAYLTAGVLCFTRARVRSHGRSGRTRRSSRKRSGGTCFSVICG